MCVDELLKTQGIVGSQSFKNFVATKTWNLDMAISQAILGMYTNAKKNISRSLSG